MGSLGIRVLAVAGCAVWSACAAAQTAGVRDALSSGRLGLYEATGFRLADGRCADCRTIPQALWYFREDMIAVPKAAPAGFNGSVRVQDDVRAWAKARQSGESTLPPLIWIGSPQIAEGRLSADGKALLGADGRHAPYKVTQKIKTNLSYYDASSVRHFGGRALRLRGRMEGDVFAARTIWPDDYGLDFGKLAAQPLGKDETLATLVRAEQGGARLPLQARVIWQRDPAAERAWGGKPVLGIMLNGAQGDDDEAHGGHFAIATGVFGPRGEWGDWLVNNFYNLDSFSEKGIIASVVPMDGYMADLNSGQSWYRPSYMLVAVLKDQRAPALYQAAIHRVYNRFYRHDFRYAHATANCAGISLETLRSLGWAVPTLGPTSRAKAIVALPYKALADWSLDSGRKAFDYLTADQSNLMPFMAFRTAGADLLDLGAGRRAPAADFEGMLKEDLEALIFIRIPQFPSSREFGQAPVDGLDEYMKRLPEDESKMKIVPVDPRPFPPEMRDLQAAAEAEPPSTYAIYAWGAVLLAVPVFGFGYWRKRRRKR